MPLPSKPPCTCMPTPHHHCQWAAPQLWDNLEVSKVPAEPGFYVFTNHDGPLDATSGDTRVLYVGESKNLLKRMRQYKVQGLSAFAFAGAVKLLSSQGVSTGYDADGRFQVKPHGSTHATVYRKGQAPQTIRDAIYVRWAVDPRKAIEQKLIHDLRPLYNTIHSGEE